MRRTLIYKRPGYALDSLRYVMFVVETLVKCFICLLEVILIDTITQLQDCSLRPFLRAVHVRNHKKR